MKQPSARVRQRTRPALARPLLSLSPQTSKTALRRSSAFPRINSSQEALPGQSRHGQTVNGQLENQKWPSTTAVDQPLTAFAKLLSRVSRAQVLFVVEVERRRREALLGVACAH